MARARSSCATPESCSARGGSRVTACSASNSRRTSAAVAGGPPPRTCGRGTFPVPARWTERQAQAGCRCRRKCRRVRGLQDAQGIFEDRTWVKPDSPYMKGRWWRRFRDYLVDRYPVARPRQELSTCSHSPARTRSRFVSSKLSRATRPAKRFTGSFCDALGFDYAAQHRWHLALHEAHLRQGAPACLHLKVGVSREWVLEGGTGEAIRSRQKQLLSSAVAWRSLVGRRRHRGAARP